MAQLQQFAIMLLRRTAPGDIKRNDTGMKNLLILTASIALGAAAPAFGADLAGQPVNIKAPPFPVVAPINDWSGYYIGLNGGWGSSHNCWDFNGDTSEGCHNSTGGTVGGQIGYRWQIFKTVYGIEGQGNWADFSGSNVSSAFPADTIGTKTDAFGLLTGHVGYAFNAVLLYAKGGAAVTSNTYHVNSVATGTELGRNDVRWGGALGAGAEVSLTPNWSVGLEYDHLFMQGSNVSFPAAVGFDRVHQDIDLVTARLNYKFGPAFAK
ncbi:outer membrane immunogenic protein [Bradyrhizobium sp. USDA 3364]